jgi:hypothetical protein
MTTSIPQEQTKTARAKATTKPRVAKRPAHVAPSKAKPAHKAASAKKAAPVRRGTKTAKILDLLKRPDGVTLKELTKATGWQAHSVRGFLSGAMARRWGFASSPPNSLTATAPTKFHPSNLPTSSPPCSRARRRPPR